MSNKMSNLASYRSKWDVAIHDAEAEIESLKRRQARLERAKQVFKANKRDGVPWPEICVEGGKK